MTFTFLLIPAYMLALTPVFARGWASFFIGFSLFAIAEALLGWLFFSGFKNRILMMARV